MSRSGAVTRFFENHRWLGWVGVVWVVTLGTIYAFTTQSPFWKVGVVVWTLVGTFNCAAFALGKNGELDRQLRFVSLGGFVVVLLAFLGMILTE